MMMYRSPIAVRGVRRLILPMVALPLLALALAPGAARTASAHPAAGTIPAVCCAPPGITLHFHALIGGLISPYRMGSDAQGNLYVSDIANDRVYMYSAAGSFVR